ncbi:hypothetical protein BDF14DRAFT_1754764, partial [Spinellus fusiger]
MLRATCELSLPSYATMFPFRPQPAASTSTETAGANRKQRLLNSFVKVTSPSTYFQHGLPVPSMPGRGTTSTSTISATASLLTINGERTSPTNRSSIGTIESDQGGLSDSHHWALRVINPDPDDASDATEEHEEVQKEEYREKYREKYREPPVHIRVHREDDYEDYREEEYEDCREDVHREEVEEAGMTTTEKHPHFPSTSSIITEKPYILPVYDDTQGGGGEEEVRSQQEQFIHRPPMQRHTSALTPDSFRRQSKTIENHSQANTLEYLPSVEVSPLLGMDSLIHTLPFVPIPTTDALSVYSPTFPPSPSPPTSGLPSLYPPAHYTAHYTAQETPLRAPVPTHHPMTRMEDRPLPSWYQDYPTTCYTPPPNTPFSHPQADMFYHGVDRSEAESGLISRVTSPVPSHDTRLLNVPLVKTSTNMASSKALQHASKYAKASYSLTNHPNTIKLYRNQALKTGDPGVQLSFAKYLLELASLYETGQKKATRASLSYGLGATFSMSSSSKRKSMRGYQEEDPMSPLETRVSRHGGSGGGSGGGNGGLDPQPESYPYGFSLPNMEDLDPLYLNSSTHTTSVDELNAKKKKALEEEGVRWVKRLAKEGVGEAALMQALWMDQSLYGFRKNNSKAFKLLTVAANQGITEGMYALALHYEKEEKSVDAFHYFQKAAEKGLPDAVFRMAKVNLHGDLHQRQNTTRGLELLHQTIAMTEDSYSEPLYLLGLLLTNTYPLVDVPKLLADHYGGAYAAVTYIERAARSGHHEAQSKLGYIYEYGMFGMPVHLAKSAASYYAAVKSGNAHAMLGLSRLLNHGSHGPENGEDRARFALDVSGWALSHPRDEDGAFHWCQRASEKGLPEALSMLGQCYEMGIGVPRDYDRALTYYQKASAKGHQLKEAQRGNYLRYTQDSSKENQNCILM